MMVKIGVYPNVKGANDAVKRNKKRYRKVVKKKLKTRGYNRFAIYGYGRR